jgi:hypothetical protein
MTTPAQLDIEGKPWIQTFSGHPFPVGDPSAEDFKLVDIGHHLSRLNRYTGAIHVEHYSVAEHSVRVAYYLRGLVARELSVKDPHVLTAAFRAGLMHDAHEAYLNDLNSPLKRALLAKGSHGYHDLAVAYDTILAQRYGLDGWVTNDGFDLIREADLAMLDLERPRVMGKPPRPWSDLGKLQKLRLPSDPMFDRWGWAPNFARATFMRAAAQCGLTGT